METDFMDVTEISGDDVSMEQITRICNRYYWASGFCLDKDVVEVACGSGQGLGYLASISKTLEAGDYSPKIVDIAKKYYKDRINISVFDAQKMPYKDQSKDVVVIFEAIYYLPDFEKFVLECKRVLRKGGYLLIASANKDLFDFNPSPFSFSYYGVTDLSRIFEQTGFSPEFWGDTPISEVSTTQKLLRPIKKIAVKFNLIPKSMRAKKILKRLVFGQLMKMPSEITNKTSEYIQPVSIGAKYPDAIHKVIFCAARLINPT